MQQIVFKKDFSVLLNAVETENVWYLEEKTFRKSRLIFKKISSKCTYSMPGVSQYQILYQYDFPFRYEFVHRQSHRQTLCFIINRNSFTLQYVRYSAAGWEDTLQTFVQSRIVQQNLHVIKITQKVQNIEKFFMLLGGLAGY